MTITGTPPTAETAQSPLTGGGPQVMGKDDFLKLLVTQLSNQDPLNPMDGQQFAAQLAQFSSVEQLMNISEGIGSQSEMNGLMAQNINTGVATGLIGKHVDAESNQTNIGGDGDPTVGFELGSAAASVDIAVKDASGRIVRTLNVKGLEAGKHDFEWNGRDNNGNTLPEGAYSFDISAKDADGDAVASTPRVSGTVDRISFGPEGIQVWIGPSAVSLGSVVSVEQNTK